MTSHDSATRIGPREAVILIVTTVFFTATVLLAALGLPVNDILILMSGTAGAAVVTVTAMTLAGAVRSARVAEREALAVLARLAAQA
ncbi:hypothetical protein ABZ135_23125 [Streptomyces sp. NPDC006339]|uniref:hypothetical protein n=1 Tax=Streptomyces sp. NPDC006339 TaxID=3156755 RepID=UPI0033B34F60